MIRGLPVIVATQLQLSYIHWNSSGAFGQVAARNIVANVLQLNATIHRGETAMPFPQTAAPGSLQNALQSRGIRLTHQRRIILEIIETAKQHLDAAQILRKAAKLDPDINRVTVYRTLSLLKRHGLVDELDLLHVKGEGHFYERRPQRDHMHMTCLRCGKVQEFESDLFDRVKGQVERDCQFHILIARFEIGGYCASCRR
jgi:Fur family ferric uptake transcriptional regulator